MGSSSGFLLSIISILLVSSAASATSTQYDQSELNKQLAAAADTREEIEPADFFLVDVQGFDNQGARQRPRGMSGPPAPKPNPPTLYSTPPGQSPSATDIVWAPRINRPSSWSNL